MSEGFIGKKCPIGSSLTCHASERFCLRDAVLGLHVFFLQRKYSVYHFIGDSL